MKFDMLSGFLLFIAVAFFITGETQAGLGWGAAFCIHQYHSTEDYDKS